MHLESIQNNIWTDSSEKFPIAQPVDIPHQEAPESRFIWTWTSQEFPMAQVGYLAKNNLVSHCSFYCSFVFLRVEKCDQVNRR